jgi:hypothetical protein
MTDLLGIPPERALAPADHHRIRALLNDEAGRKRGPLLDGWRTRLLVVAALGTVGLLVTLSGGQGGRAVDTAAADALNNAAVTAQNQPPLPALTEGHYLYLKNVSTGYGKDGWWTFPLDDPASTWTARVQMASETWIAADGSWTQNTSAISDPVFASDGDRAAWVAAGSPTPWLASRTQHSQSDGDRFSFYYPDGLISYQQLQDLPTDPDRLGAQIGAAVQPNQTWSHDEQEFDDITQMLSTDPLQPAQRAALYQVLAGLPGVELLGRVDSRIGQPGVAVAIHDNGFEFQAIFDPNTAELIGEATNGFTICCWNGFRVVDSTNTRPDAVVAAPRSWTLPSEVENGGFCRRDCLLAGVG